MDLNCYFYLKDLVMRSKNLLVLGTFYRIVLYNCIITSYNCIYVIYAKNKTVKYRRMILVILSVTMIGENKQA